MILITSSIRAGSWVIRGEQLGKAIGAVVSHEPTQEQIFAADIVVVVKRATPELLSRLGMKPVVLDVVDPWPQPTGNCWDRVAMTTWLRAHVLRHSPVAAVCTTDAMARAMPEGLQTLVLPHHARPDQQINPVRRTVQAVGYQGSSRYLDGWRQQIEAECSRRGWMFVVNPVEMASLDIVLAVRGGIWRGWATDNYKSNVKLANAQATGTPIILLPERGSLESMSGGEVWIEHPGELSGAFDCLTPQEERANRSAMLCAKAPRLDAIAESYSQWLRSL